MKLTGLVVAAIVAAVVALSAGGDGGAGQAGSGGDRIVRVVDGDTVVLAALGKTRLIGVDTPEVYGGAECFGRAASAFAKRVLVPGLAVKVRIGVEPRDRYGRALAYVYLPDGTMFNEVLVREGYAQTLTIPPNVDHADRFRALAKRARERGRGLWSACGSR